MYSYLNRNKRWYQPNPNAKPEHLAALEAEEDCDDCQALENIKVQQEQADE